MPLIPLIAARKRRKKLLTLGSDPISESLTTFTNGDWDVVADGSTEATLTLTVRDTENAVMPGEPVTFSVVRTSVSAGVSSVGPSTLTPATDEAVSVAIAVRNADGTPLPGIPAASIVVALSGSNVTVTQPTGVTNHNGQISGAEVEASTAGARTLTVTVCGQVLTEQPSINVGGSGTANPDIEFAVDWGNSTGTTEAALTDGSQFSEYNNDDSLLSVVSAAALEFPTTNALRVQYNQPGPFGHVIRTAGPWTVPSAEGEILAYRVYFRYSIPDGFGSQSLGAHHPIETNFGTCAGYWSWKMGYASDGTFPFMAYLGSGGNFTLNTNLDKDTTYRLEWLFTRKASASQYRITPRIYLGDSTTVLYDGDDFLNDAAQSITAADPTVPLTEACLAQFFLGNNDPAGWTVTSGSIYYGGLAIGASTTFLGPYVSGE